MDESKLSEWVSTKKPDETNEQWCARVLSEFVNGRIRSPKRVAEEMAKDHRYLQQEMFKICYEYMKILAENNDKGWYDARNEWACNTAKKMIDSLEFVY